MFMFSCQKMEYTQQFSWAYPLSGEWALQLEYGGTVDPGPYFIKVYNTAFGQDSVWIDDNGNIIGFKVKAKADVKALTFSSSNYIAAGDTTTISNGKIINKDSIYFEFVSTNPIISGIPFKMYGHRSTSYEEYNMPH